MPHFKELMQSLKFKAIMNLQEDSNSQAIFENCFGISVESLFDGNQNPNDVQDGPAFYKEIIDLYKLKQRSNREAVFNSPVCYNSWLDWGARFYWKT